MSNVSFGSGGGAPAGNSHDPMFRYTSQLLSGNYAANVHGGADQFAHGGAHGKKQPNKLAQVVAMGIAGFAAWRFGLVKKLANVKFIKNLNLGQKLKPAKDWITKTFASLTGKGGEAAAAPVKAAAKKAAKKAPAAAG